MRNVFIVRMSNDGFKEYALRESKIVIGWSDVLALRSSQNDDPIVRRENIKEALIQSGLYGSQRAIGNVAGSIDRFIYSIRENDYVTFPVFKGFYVGIVMKGDDGRAIYNESQVEFDRAWQWDVKWNSESGKLKKYSRSVLSAKLYYSLKTQFTCHLLASGSDSELEACVSRIGGVDLNQKLLDEDNHYLSTVKSEIQTSLNHNTFEDFIVKILEKEGACKVQKLAKNQGLNGDVDIISVFSVNSCGADRADEFVYGYQCKHHVGETDTLPIEQLIDRVHDDSNDINYQKLYAVTSGYFSSGAIDCAKSYNDSRQSHQPSIELIDGICLAKWVIELGLRGIEIH